MSPTPNGNALTILFSDRKIGAASKLAFFQLWTFAGETPGRIVVTADWLGSSCGRSPKAAWLWLEELQAHDLIKIGERNERRGTIDLDLYNPCPGNREATPDFQTTFPVSPATEVLGDFQSTFPVPPATEVLEPKPPTPLVPKKYKDTSYQSTNSKDPMDSMNEGSMAETFQAMTAAMIQSSEPAEQKARLKARIISACHRAVADWVAGAAANLVRVPRRPARRPGAHNRGCGRDVSRRFAATAGSFLP